MLLRTVGSPRRDYKTVIAEQTGLAVARVGHVAATGAKELAMFEIFSKLGSPELQAMIETLPAKVAEWSDFLKKLDASQKRLIEQNEAIENKLQYVCDASGEISDKLTLIMSETAITPELHGEVLDMVQSDPRQMRLFIPGGGGEPIQ